MERFSKKENTFNLSAHAYADESVPGQWTDRFSGGFHAVIDCLVVDGYVAYVSGVAS